MERERVIDYAKGIGILLVVLGHTRPGLPSPLMRVIYSFHMPLFFIISGYLYNKAKYDTYSFKEFVGVKFKRYIIPYFVISLICFIAFHLVGPLLGQGYSDDYLKQLFKYSGGILYSRGIAEWMPTCAPLWFLTCLFITESMFFLINKFDKGKIISLVICAIMGYLLSTLNLKLPWNIDTALTAVIFMCFGHILKKHNILKKLKAINMIIIIGLFIVSIKYNNCVISFDDNKYGNILLMYIGAISGSLITMYACLSIKNIEFLKFMGKNTLVIMGFNYVARFAGEILTKGSILDNIAVKFLIQIIILSVLVVAIKKVSLLNELINGNNEPFEKPKQLVNW